MGLISSSIPNFVNGVSQQPFTLRLATQGDLQENGLSTVAQGLKKRPGTRHLAKLLTTPLAGDAAFVHIINRDDIEKYIVVVTNGDLKVFDTSGNAKTVNFPGGKDYLSSATVRKSFRAVSVADYTFFLNKGVTVTEDLSTPLQPFRGYEALINVKSGNYGKSYTINVNGAAVTTYTTPDGSSATQSSQISTDYIAEVLRAGCATNLPGWTVMRSGSVLYLKSPSADFTISVDDGFNNNAMVCIKDKLQKFSDLPSRCPVDGFYVEITGDSSSAFDNYYVKFELGQNKSSGVWRETCQANLSKGVYAPTMPHALVREADGTFTFKPMLWDYRKVGDATSNPHPTFVGRTINEVFFYRNRLGLLVDENILFSEAGSYFNFYRATATQLLDSDPIDVAVSHNKVSILQHAVPFNKQLLVFSAQSQFVLDQNEILSPKTVSVKQTTEFSCNVQTRPVGVGKNIYFATDKGDWTAIREFYADFNNLSNDAADVTAHIPKYIPSGAVKLTVSTNEDAMCLLTSSDPTALYVYKYFWTNNEKLQSAWSKWTFPPGNNILNIEFIQSELFLVVSRLDGVFLERMNVSLGFTEANEPYQILLDRKQFIPRSLLSYNAGTGRTYITSGVLPTVPENGERLLAVALQGGAQKAGSVVEISADALGYYVPGNFAGTDFAIGRPYTFKYRLSTITVKTAATGGGTKSDTEGRLQLRKVAFNFADTGSFDVTVKPHNRDPYRYRYSGKSLGTETATIGQPSFDTGRFLVPVVTRNIDTEITIENETPYPCSILSADWEGFYVKRSQAI